MSGGATRALILRGTAAAWAQYAAAIGVTLLLTPFVLGRVGPAAYGVWLFLNQAIGYSSLLDLGIQPALVRYVAEARACRDESELQQVLGTSLRFYLMAAAACVVLGLFIAAVLPHWFDLGSLSVQAARRTAVIGAVAAALALPATAITGALKGFQRFDLAAALGLGSNLLRAAVTVVALRLDLGLPGLAAAALCSNAAMLVLGALLLRRLTGVGGQVFVAGSRDAFRRMLSVGAFSLVGAAGWQLAYGSDTLLVGARLTAVDAAHFGLAVNVMAIVSAMVGAFTGHLLPLASGYAASKDLRKAQDAYLAGTRIALTLALLPMVLFLVEGPSLLTAWLGPQVGRPSGQLLQFLVIAYLPNVLNAAALPLALGLGLHRAAGVLALSEGVLKIAVALLCIGRLGTAGVALATLIAASIHQGFLWPWILSTRLEIRLTALWKGAVLPVLLPAGALVGGLLLLEGLAPNRSLPIRLVTAVAVAGVCWAPMVVALVGVRKPGPTGTTP